MAAMPAAQTTHSTHGRNTAVMAPPVDRFRPPAAFTPIPINTSFHMVNRSSDDATAYSPLDAVVGSMNAPGLNIRGFRISKSAGDFMNMTAIASTVMMTPGMDP